MRKEEKWKIPLYKIFTDDEDVIQINKILRRGRDWAIGSEIEEFENLIKNYVGTDYCAVLNSGTSALHATLLSYGIGTNDEVILPSFSFVSTANSIQFVNAIPKFSEIEDLTFGLDPNFVESQISDKTKAIMPMDYGGTSCQIFELQEIANKHNLPLIEDAAESLGSSVLGKKVGSVSDSAIFSFCGNKVLTTGEGGAVVTNSKKIYEKIKLLSSHGRVDQKSYFNNQNESQYIGIGYNWRMSSLTAGLGISQIKKLDKIIKMRQENAQFLSSRLSSISELKTPSSTSNYEHIFQMYTIRLKDNKTRNSLHDYLTKKRIFSKVYFPPIHLTNFYKSKYGYVENSLPLTEKISQEVLTLPLYPNMTIEEKKFLVESIKEFFE
jgi:perosamine synthetase